MSPDSSPSNFSKNQRKTQIHYSKATATDQQSDVPVSDSHLTPLPLVVTVIRSVFGGVLMGLANLLPGISGGTMLLATGIYPIFVQSISDLTRFKFNTRSLVVLATVAISAGLAILSLAGLLRDLVLENRWIMYSLFIGLTLGGLPLVGRMARPINRSVLIAAVLSVTGMIAMVVLQVTGYAGDSTTGTFALFLAGVLGASAMILPGLSGAYLLILLGQYLPILSAIEDFKESLKMRDLSAAIDPAMVLLPVGVGVIIGIVVVSNLLRWMLQRFEKITLGILIGLLIGSVFGLYPFQVAVPPEFGDMIKGQMVTAENVDSIKSKDWPIEYRLPTIYQIVGSLGLIALGYLVTAAMARIGKVQKL